MGNLVFSGIQPSGAIHIGNYAGAIRNWVKLQDELECIYCIVDYHAMTQPYQPHELSERVLNAALDLLACGVDPERSNLFVQSSVPEHTELTWILSCIAPMGELNRMTQFKEKSDRLESVNVGLFTYPVLQAADILIYKADTVPVGEDQVQHLEVTREIARRFNATFGDTFPEPKPLLTQAPRIMSLNDPETKMSKSIEGSAVMLSDDDDTIRKKLKRAVTGMGAPGEETPGVKNMFTLLDVFAPPEVAQGFRADLKAGSIRYSDLKESLTEHMLAVLGPIREKRRELENKLDDVRDLLIERGRLLRLRADDTLEEVREKVGLTALR